MIRRNKDNPLSVALDYSSVALICSLLALMVSILSFYFGDIVEEDDISAVSVSLSALQVFLVVVAFSGFWMLRGIVREQADIVTEKLVSEQMKVISSEIDAKVGRIAMRAVNQYLKDGGLNGNGTGDEMADAFGGENGGETDEQ